MVERFIIYLYTGGCMGVSDTEDSIMADER